MKYEPEQSRGVQGENHYVFISYPHREEEVERLYLLIQNLREEIDRRIERERVEDVFRLGSREFRRFAWLDRNEELDLQYAPLENSIVDGVRKSKHMLSFITPIYWSSGWCRFEWGVARGADVPICPIVWKGELAFPPSGFPAYHDARELTQSYNSYIVWEPRRGPRDETEMRFYRLIEDVARFLMPDLPAL